LIFCDARQAMSIKPRAKVPDLDLPALDRGRFNLGAQPRQFTLLLFYP